MILGKRIKILKRTRSDQRYYLVNQSAPGSPKLSATVDIIGLLQDDFLKTSFHLFWQCDQNVTQHLTIDEAQETCFRLDLLKHSIISSLHDPRDAQHTMPPQFVDKRGSKTQKSCTFKCQDVSEGVWLAIKYSYISNRMRGRWVYVSACMLDQIFLIIQKELHLRLKL